MEAADSASASNGSGRSCEDSRHTSAIIRREDAANHLNAAFEDALRGNWKCYQVESPNSHASVEFETLRRAVERFVATYKADQCPPERVLVQLKETLSVSALVTDREAEQEVLREVILGAFLRSYFEGTEH